MNKLEEFKKIVVAMFQQYRDKNQDYGDSFGETFAKFGIISALTRISDKYNRIVSLFKNGENKVKDESVEDTLLDLACYCV